MSGGRTGSGVPVPGGSPAGAGPISRPVIDVEGSAGVYTGSVRGTGEIVAVVYQTDRPEWWRGIVRKTRIRELYLPTLDDPTAVVERFLT